MVPVRKKLRRLRQLLVNSRYALDEASRSTSTPWLGDLLFTLACRRSIMLNELDRELGQMHVPATPVKDADHFRGFPASSSGPQLYVEVCQEEERYLERELESLKFETGLHVHTRDTVGLMLAEIKANLRDILFLRRNHPALQN